MHTLCTAPSSVAYCYGFLWFDNLSAMWPYTCIMLIFYSTVLSPCSSVMRRCIFMTIQLHLKGLKLFGGAKPTKAPAWGRDWISGLLWQREPHSWRHGGRLIQLCFDETSANWFRCPSCPSSPSNLYSLCPSLCRDLLFVGASKHRLWQWFSSYDHTSLCV